MLVCIDIISLCRDDTVQTYVIAVCIIVCNMETWSLWYA